MTTSDPVPVEARERDGESPLLVCLWAENVSAGCRRLNTAALPHTLVSAVPDLDPTTNVNAVWLLCRWTGEEEREFRRREPRATLA